MFAVEKWNSIKDEILPLWHEHHEEVADREDRDRVPLDPDWQKYQDAHDAGRLLIIVERECGEIVAYVFVFVDTHIHYRSLLCAFLDLYWVDPNSRGHWHGVKMFRAVQAECRLRGVKKMFGATKIWLDASAIFLRTGWKRSEFSFTQWIG